MNEHNPPVEQELGSCQVYDTPSTLAGLSLCQRCIDIGWDQITIHNMTIEGIRSQRGDISTTIQDYVSIKQLAESPHCALCISVLNAYSARSQVHPQLHSWPPHRIVIYLSGPFYLDEGVDHNGNILPRIPDLSDPDCIVIKMFLSIEVRCLPWKDPSEAVSEQYIFTKKVGQVDVPIKEVSNAPTQFTATPQFEMRYSNQSPPVLLGIDEWEVSFFDIEMIKGWLRHCDDAHGIQCMDREIGNADFPVGFRVIDTLDMKILQPDGFVRYVALSYMWSGGPDENMQLERSNVEALEEPGGIERFYVPGIVADAIALCRDLGERYIWVDRLCIIQDDPETKPGQINAMDKIYHSAAFTVVAALNTRNGTGLPGYRNRSRHPRSSLWTQPHAGDVEAQGFKVAGNISNVIDTSLWNKRGWTFQERLLSNRRLFFTEHQVCFECCQGQATELLTWAHPTVCSSDNYSAGIGKDTCSTQGVNDSLGFYVKDRYSIDGSYTMKETTSLQDYCTWVKDYSSRQLSFGADVLNAFTGVGNALNTVLGTRMVYGLPEIHLSRCLLWTSLGALHSRGETYHIPSWSWASSLTPVHYDWHCSVSDKQFLKTASIVYFYYQGPDQGLRKLDIREGWIYDEVTIEDLSEREELPRLRGKHVPGDWRTNKDWRECPQNPWETFKRQTMDPRAREIAAIFPGSLVFNTTAASLAIDHLHYVNGIPTKYEVSDAALKDRRGENVGILSMVEYGWVEARRSTEGNKKLFDFIVLSGELEKYRTRNTYSFVERWADMWLLDVMLVERLPCEPFVARRVAIGTVTLHRWKDCDTRWETVVLG
ncbi:hypothetical protein M426DRAFT_320746 [Hypoxylon sp. CI-4A]|nr:hypothetical protein M426DRAFT_320746 [Hypoxylon sp. CI-4A]